MKFIKWLLNSWMDRVAIAILLILFIASLISTIKGIEYGLPFTIGVASIILIYLAGSYKSWKSKNLDK